MQANFHVNDQKITALYWLIENVRGNGESPSSFSIFIK
jgi:hypothetical protein